MLPGGAGIAGFPLPRFFFDLSRPVSRTAHGAVTAVCKDLWYTRLRPEMPRLRFLPFLVGISPLLLAGPAPAATSTATSRASRAPPAAGPRHRRRRGRWPRRRIGRRHRRPRTDAADGPLPVDAGGGQTADGAAPRRSRPLQSRLRECEARSCRRLRTSAISWRRCFDEPDPARPAAGGPGPQPRPAR